MPIYEYRRPDGSTFEIMQSFSDDPLTADPETGVPVERVLHAPAIHFKGKGFHNTDYGTRRRNRELKESADKGADKKAASSESAGSSSSSGDGGSSSSSSNASTSSSTSSSSSSSSASSGGSKD